MRKPKALVIAQREEAMTLERDLRAYEGIPPIEVTVAQSPNEYDQRKLNEQEFDLCVLSGDFTQKDQGLQGRISQELPFTRVIVTYPIRINGESPTQTTDSILGQQLGGVSSVLDRLLTEDKIKRRLRLNLIGLGKFGREIVRKFIPDPDVKVQDDPGIFFDCFSGSADECTGRNTGYSYKSISDALGLDPMTRDISQTRVNRFNRPRLIFHKSLDSWISAAPEADLVIFVSGPHEEGYDNKPKEEIRGKKAKKTYVDWFKDVAPKLDAAFQGLREIQYDGDIWPLSNPIGPSMLRARRILRNGNNIWAPTLDGLRASIVMAKRLNENRDVRRYAPNYRFNTTDITECPMIGDHHSIIYLFNHWRVNIKRDEIVYLSSLVPQASSEVFRQLFMKKLTGEFEEEVNEKAVDTMAAAKKLETGYAEAPDTVVKTLDAIAHFKAPPRYTTYQMFSREASAFTLYPSVYNVREQRPIPTIAYSELFRDIPKDEAEKLKKKFDSQMNWQKRLARSKL